MKRRVLYNKMMLGALTLGDLRQLVRLEGELRFGTFWLPICNVRRSKEMLRFFCFSQLETRNPDVEVPLDSVVHVQDNVVTMKINTSDITGGHMMTASTVELVIRLDKAPFPKLTGNQEAA